MTPLTLSDGRTMTLTELQALSDEGLKVVAGKAAGYSLTTVNGMDEHNKPESLWALSRGGKITNIGGKVSALDEDRGFMFSLMLPRFTRSLDACAPLLDEMAAAGRRIAVHIYPDADPLSFNFSLGVEMSGRWIELWMTKTEVLPRLLCIAYVLFKQGQQQTI